MEKILVSIDTGYANFGIICQGGKVIEAAPIANWAIGKSAKFVIDYYRKSKGATIYVHPRKE